MPSGAKGLFHKFVKPSLPDDIHHIISKVNSGVPISTEENVALKSWANTLNSYVYVNPSTFHLPNLPTYP